MIIYFPDKILDIDVFFISGICLMDIGYVTCISIQQIPELSVQAIHYAV